MLYFGVPVGFASLGPPVASSAPIQSAIVFALLDTAATAHAAL